jgi:hypothetical protein
MGSSVTLNLLELIEACPLDPSEMMAIDLGTVFDGAPDSAPDRIEPSICADGSGLSACTDGIDPAVSACTDGNEEPSDVRLKTDIEQVGTTVYGLPLYHFRYKTGPERFEGVMAQDVLEVMPDAVVSGEDGHYRVKYSHLGIRMTAV